MSGKIFAGFILGALTGAAACYFVLRSEFEKTMEKEVANFKEKYAAKREAPKEKDISVEATEKTDEKDPVVTETKEEVYNDLVNKQVIHYENYAKKYRGKSKPSLDINMEKLTKKDMLDVYEDQLEDETFDDEGEEDEDLYPFEEADTPISIDSDKFSSDTLHDKVTLLYFKKDNLLLVADEDEEFEDPEKFLGDSWDEAIGEFESGVAYIRNDKNLTDYEIIEENGHYIRE